MFTYKHLAGLGICLNIKIKVFDNGISSELAE